MARNFRPDSFTVGLQGSLSSHHNLMVTGKAANQKTFNRRDFNCFYILEIKQFSFGENLKLLLGSAAEILP